MKIKIISFEKKRFIETNIRILFSVIVLFLFLGTTQISAQESTSQFIQGTDTLVVYKDVPGQVSSDKYTIRVKSALTNGQWVDVFAHYTYNRAGELPADGRNLTITNYQYQWFTDKWSHTYGNIEMSKNTPIEVEIAFKSPTFTIAGQPVFKAAAHPASKVSIQPVVTNGKIYFTINKPGQVAIDINGQMDDYHAAINPMPLVNGKSAVVHAISLFANPVLAKPSLTGSRTYYVEANADTAITRHLNPALYDTLYFKPGVHKLGINFKIYPGKKYYIPGDAIVYGSLNNFAMPTVGLIRAGQDIKIYGYGTISSQGIPHPMYVPGSEELEYEPIFITDALNAVVNGICIADPCHHSLKLQTSSTRPDKMKPETFTKWVKIISWRANGDGIGSAEQVEDCFLRTADDASYIKGNRIRTIFWRDVHAAGFHMAGIPAANDGFPIVIEDCDVIYHRSRDVVGSNGGIFHQRAEGTVGQQTVNVTVRNFRSEDKRANSPFFNMYSSIVVRGVTSIGSSYSGITFQNISIASNQIKQVLTGCLEAPWDGGVTFDNLTIDGTLITQANFTSYFTTNTFTKNIIFKNSANYTLTLTNSENGTIVPSSTLPNFADGTNITLTAVPKPGYEFISWSGDVTGTANPTSISMTKNSTVSATFQKATVFTFQNPGQGSWIVPAGVNSITLAAWGAGGAGGGSFNGSVTAPNYRGGGGAGGSYAAKTISVMPGELINFTVGAGGVGTAQGFANASRAESGGDTFASLNTQQVVLALGGQGGENAAAPTAGYNGLGGVVSATANLGDVVKLGGNGGSAGTGSVGVGSGGGGGSAGADSAGGAGEAINGGAAGAGGGAIGGKGTNSTTINPLKGGFPGGGGAGSTIRVNQATDTYKVASGGGNGKFVITTNVSSGLLTSKDDDISIFPNPTADKLYFKTTKTISKIQLLDLTGKVVFSINNTTDFIDLSNIARGMYVVRAYTQQRVFSTKISKI